MKVDDMFCFPEKSVSEVPKIILGQQVQMLKVQMLKVQMLKLQMLEAQVLEAQVLRPRVQMLKPRVHQASRGADSFLIRQRA